MFWNPLITFIATSVCKFFVVALAFSIIIIIIIILQSTKDWSLMSWS